MGLRLEGKDKAAAKRHIVALVTPFLRERRFEAIAGGRTGGTFRLVGEDGARLLLSIGAPTFDSILRLWSSWEPADGSSGVGGPRSEPYAAPNTPGKRRYAFRFNRAVESQERCARDVEAWVRDELLPWFAARPTAHWAHPRVPPR